jgi:hypothetical protein
MGSGFVREGIGTGNIHLGAWGRTHRGPTFGTGLLTLVILLNGITKTRL